MKTQRRKPGPKKVNDDAQLVEGPKLLLGAVRVAAEREGVSVTEWWRRAARLRLGWREVLPEDDP